MNKNLPIVIIGLVAVVAIVAGIILYQNNRAATAPAPTSSAGGNSGGAQNYNPSDAIQKAPPGASPAWARGASNALVTLEEFADFECGSCAAFEPVLKEVKTAYGDRVRIIFRQYPLVQIHQRAYDAARAAEAAGQQGKFWEMKELLFAKQKDWSLDKTKDHRQMFAEYAKSIGLDADKFNADLVGQIASQRVAADKQRGDSVKIGSTPSLFLNGRLLTPQEMSVSNLRQAIDKELQGR